MKQFFLRYKYEVVLVFLVIFYTVLFSYLGIHRVNTFRSHYYDLGIMDQVVYNTSKGRFLEMTNQDLVKNLPRFAIHFDPILAFFAPFYLIYPSPNVLIVGQAAIVFLGGIAIYLLGLEIIKDKRMSLVFAFSYLNFFPVLRQVLFDFHGIALATTFILFALYFALRKNSLISIVFVILSLLTKENVGLVTMLLGCYLFLFKKQYKTGISIVGISILFFVTTVFYIIPQARQGQHFALKYFSDFGDTPSKVLIGIITNPQVALAPLFDSQAQEYIKRLLMSHGIFMLFGPVEFLISLPELFITLLSKNNNMRQIYFHYQAVLIPFIFFSSLVGYARTKKKIKGALFSFLISLFVVGNLVSIYYYSPLPLPFLHEPFEFKNVNTTKLKIIHEWQEKLKDDQIKVATTPQIAPFFTHRQYYYNFLFDPALYSLVAKEGDIIKESDRFKLADYVVVAKSELNPADPVVKVFIDQLTTHPDFVVVYDQDDIAVYKKK